MKRPDPGFWAEWARCRIRITITIFSHFGAIDLNRHHRGRYWSYGAHFCAVWKRRVRAIDPGQRELRTINIDRVRADFMSSTKSKKYAVFAFSHSAGHLGKSAKRELFHKRFKRVLRLRLRLWHLVPQWISVLMVHFSICLRNGFHFKVQ